MPAQKCVNRSSASRPPVVRPPPPALGGLVDWRSIQDLQQGKLGAAEPFFGSWALPREAEKCKLPTPWSLPSQPASTNLVHQRVARQDLFSLQVHQVFDIKSVWYIQESCFEFIALSTLAKRP